jgi:Na+/melibiose symporter-like transporter
MGLITDRTKTRFGKHRIWLVAALPVLLIGYLMKWYSFGISATGTFPARAFGGNEHFT